MVIDTLRAYVARQPFEPFAIRTSGGQAYVVADPQLIVLMKTRAFVAEAGSDRAATIPYLHIASIQAPLRRPPGHRRRRGT